MKLLKPLTSLRFFAALGIFSYHLHYFFYKTPKGTIFYNKYFSYGYLGVSFFFMLSGLVLTYRYSYFLNKISWDEIKIFYLKRIIGIYPAHLITLFIALPIEEIKSSHLLSRFLTNLFLIQSFVPSVSYSGSFNSEAWFISDLLFFYLLFPFFIMFLNIINILTRRIIPWLIILLAWTSVVIFITWNLPYTPALLNHNSFIYWLYYMSPFIRSVEFICGIMLGIIFLKTKEHIQQDSFSDTITELISISILFISFKFIIFIPEQYVFKSVPLQQIELVS